MANRIIALGDIHGCHAALTGLLDLLQLDETDLFITLGDYVDRGPDSRAVINTLINLKQQTQVITLKGNHEQMMLDAREGSDSRSFWLQFGGRETLESYGDSFADIPEAHWIYLENCHSFYETEEFLFVHANYLPDVPLADQSDEIRIWQHLKVVPPKPHSSGKTVFVGHTPQQSGEVLDAGHLVCIDTYCFGGKYLTAIDCQTRQKWQVDMLGRKRT